MAGPCDRQITDMASLKEMGIDTLALADCVSGVFGEMTFCHGFVHCDPHPGAFASFFLLL